MPLFVAEMALRVKNDAVLVLQDLRPGPWTSWGTFDDHDTLLGWVPRPNTFITRQAGWSASTDEYRLRQNRPPSDTVTLANPPILAIGDSGAFGDEVDDHETWPAHLEIRLERRVLNAGVSAYGIDQPSSAGSVCIPSLSRRS
jgi:hypothetical protein